MTGPVFGHRRGQKRQFLLTGTPVNVIASFKQTGDFIPIYFQISDENGERFSYKISSVNFIKDKPGMRIFVCSFISNAKKHTITLLYDIENARWLLEQNN